jgi:tRNA(His) guanylyltransferase
LTGEAVLAPRRRIKRDFDLPMKDEYSRFVMALTVSE